MKSILVSAGHGGFDPGACANGYREADLALRLRDAIAAKLKVKGVSILTDGAALTNLPLSAALKLVKAGQVAVEIHFNAAAPAATGVEVLAKVSDKAFAQKLAGAVASATGLKLRGESGWKTTDSGQHHRLAFCDAGGLILEVCFITNLDDMRAFRENESAIVERLSGVLLDAAGYQRS